MWAADLRSPDVHDYHWRRLQGVAGDSRDGCQLRSIRERRAHCAARPSRRRAARPGHRGGARAMANDLQRPAPVRRNRRADSRLLDPPRAASHDRIRSAAPLSCGRGTGPGWEAGADPCPPRRTASRGQMNHGSVRYVRGVRAGARPRLRGSPKPSAAPRRRHRERQARRCLHPR